MRRLLAAVLCVASSVTAQAMESVPKAEYHARRMALAEKLHGGVAVLFAAEEPVLDFMPYRQDSDFFYLTGWTEPGAALMVVGAGPETVAPRSGEHVPAHAYREILFLPSRNRVIELYTGAKMDASTPGAAGRAAVDSVEAVNQLPVVLGEFEAEDRRRGRLLWSQTDMPAAAAVVSFLGPTLGVDTTALRAQDVRELTMALRTVKSPAEIALLKKASDASIAAQLAGMRAIKPGVRERTIAGLEMAKFMEDGCERASYAAIVGSGPNATTLHYGENGRVMETGDVVVIDEAGEYSMYASDITRTMPVDGHFTPRQKEIYDIVLGAQRAAAAAFVAGKYRMGNVYDRTDAAVTDSLDKVAYEYINTHGKDLHGEPLGKYFLHALGHSVGIDVHDPMDYAHTRLDKGMVFTLEPGIYIPEEKIGVRIEDVVYVDGEGRLIDLIESLPHDAGSIEAAMRR